MARVVYVHVGAPKTGTTYLQDRLSRNRAELGKHGVSYPIGLHGSHFRPALDIIDRPWGGMREDVKGEWDGLAARVRRHNGVSIISHEILAGAKPSQVRRALAGLEGADVHLVYSARDLGRQIPAEWQEEVKHQRTRSFARFLSRVQTDDRSDPSTWFWRVQGLPGVLTRWGRGLAPDHVHLVTVPPAGAARDTLWLRYCTAFGLDPAWAPEEPEAANPSIGIAETALLRRLNARLKDTDLAPDQYRNLVRQLVVHETLAHRRRMVRATLPPHTDAWVAAVAEEWVEWVEGSRIDVVGDVADLRPVPLPPERRWRDPDQPRQKRMVDAALDALVAVTLEAGSRPDPHEQVTSRLGRAARRLRGQ